MTKHLRTTLATAILSLTPAVALHAQGNETQSPKIAPGTLIEPSQTFDHALTSFQKEFTAAAQAMPASSYSFAPATGIFVPSQKNDFKGVRTFAQQVIHVAQANYYYAGMIGGLKIDIDVESPQRASPPAIKFSLR